MPSSDPVAQIEAAIVALLRRSHDPRGNRQIYALAGADIERAGSVMLARIEDLEPARLSELATAAGVELSTASRQVARLVEQGYVERSVDPSDGRAALHRLTDEGRDLRRRLAAAVREWFERALADFDADERTRLASMLDRFVAALVDEPAEVAR